MNLKETVTTFIQDLRDGKVLKPEVHARAAALGNSPEALLAARLFEGVGDFRLAGLRAGAALSGSNTVVINENPVLVAAMDLEILRRLLERTPAKEIE